MIRRPPRSTLFPYTRSSDLEEAPVVLHGLLEALLDLHLLHVRAHDTQLRQRPDRKSTRLNSSHLVISYAVFCLKKKKKRTKLFKTTITMQTCCRPHQYGICP